MPLEIDADILKKANKCQMNFQCLGDVQKHCCGVEHAISPEMVMVKPRAGGVGCHYASPYGYCYICNCPARVEIYRKFKQ